MKFPSKSKASLKNYIICAIIAVLAACQTPTASNQGAASSRAATGTGQSAAPSSRYEADTFGPILPPNFPDYRGDIRRPP